MELASVADRETVGRRVLDWYAASARDLPWRARGVTPWGVMVSEFMLQQTPATRVIDHWRAWIARWPTPADLAREEPGEAVRAWGRLGYPRRAQRLHAAAVHIVERFDGRVPSGLDDLRSLPGVGEYSAAAIAGFAFGARHAVLDTNVRRVLARLSSGEKYPPPAITKAERVEAERWVPADAAVAARWAVAAMELGAQVCRAQLPGCSRCPVSEHCAWVRAGSPDSDGPPRRGQGYLGTDRMCRGALLAVLRHSRGPVSEAELLAAWLQDPNQARRALGSLLGDRLARSVGDLFTL